MAFACTCAAFGNKCFASSFAGAAARASTINRASRAKRSRRFADLTSEPNQGQVHCHPSIGWYKPLEGKSNLLVLRLLSNDSQPFADSRYVRIDRHSGITRHEGKDDVCRLVTDARQLGHYRSSFLGSFLENRIEVTTVLVEDNRRDLLDPRRLDPVEAGRPDTFNHFICRSPREHFGSYLKTALQLLHCPNAVHVTRVLRQDSPD